MLRRVEINGVELPPLYTAENKEDITLARDNGLPYVVWNHGHKRLIETLLYPTLKKLFPNINWEKFLNINETVVASTIVNVPGNIAGIPSERTKLTGKDDLTVDTAASTRMFSNGPAENDMTMLSIDAYIGDKSSSVDVLKLAELSLLPSFIGDITTCIAKNLTIQSKWSEGYNKKLGVPLGTYLSGNRMRNLIILDISNSIPRGISATMLSLLSTMRETLEADVIVTGSKSLYFEYSDALPSDQEIRNKIGLSNESIQFNKLLIDTVSKHEYNHVIAFGDNDTPVLYKYTEEIAENIRVHNVHHYHTRQKNTDVGYAKWTRHARVQPTHSHSTDWCDFIY